MSDSSPDDRTADKSEKSASAFRTISEVAAELDLPQHVLRFWETKFPQVRPMKRGGGRRYYRPDDLQLLRRIRDLLYVDGYTCLLYTSPRPRDLSTSRMPSSA